MRDLQEQKKQEFAKEQAARRANLTKPSINTGTSPKAADQLAAQ